MIKTIGITLISLCLVSCKPAHTTTDVSLTAFRPISFDYREDSHFEIMQGVVSINGQDSIIISEQPKTFVCNSGDTWETIKQIREHNAAYEAIQNTQ